MSGKNLVDVRIFLILLLITLHCHSFSLTPGKTHKYSYATNVVFNEVSKTGQKDVGYYLTTDFEVSPVFMAGDVQLVKVQLSSASLTSISRPDLKSELSILLNYPVYFELSESMVGQVYAPEKESIFCSNFKKGIISLFQLQEQNGEREELDVSGECMASYIKSGSSITKNRQNCQNLEIAGQFVNLNKLFGVTVSTVSDTHYQMLNGVIQKADGTYQSTATINVKSSINSAVTTQQSLQLLSTVDGPETKYISSVEEAVSQISKGLKQTLSSTLLPSGAEVQTCIDNCQRPLDVLKKLKDSLISEKLATAESGKAFIEMLRTFRNAGKITIEEVLTNKDSYNIVPQLIDIGAATQTPYAQRAIMDLVQFEQDYSTQYPERLLLSLAFNTHPGDFVIQDMLTLMKKKLPNAIIQESVGDALGALVHTYCQYPDQCQHEAKSKLVKIYLQIAKPYDSSVRVAALELLLQLNPTSAW